MKIFSNEFKQALYTSIRKRLKGSDYAKWAPIESFPESWDPRTKELAKLVPENTSIIEFGAGRMVLNNYLPEGCSYTPSDFVDRGDGTIVCDLNKSPLPDFSNHDVAFFAGVLEYINNIASLANHLSKDINYIVASYCSTELNTAKASIDRRAKGWVNDYNSEEFIAIFERSGFVLEEQSRWKTQPLFRFAKKD